MKTLKLLVTAFILALACSANAQSSRHYHGFVNSDTDHYGRLTIPHIVSVPYQDDEDGELLYGLGIGYLFGINLTGHHIPLFLELGPELNYVTRLENDHHREHHRDRISFNTPTRYEDELWMNVLSINTPINIAYKLRVSDNISLSPYAGVSLRYNALAMKEVDDKTYDLFDADDVNGETANRFQLGLNAGFGVYFARFYLGYRYNFDLTPFMPDENRSRYDIRMGHHYLNIGVKF